MDEKAGVIADILLYVITDRATSPRRSYRFSLACAR